MNIKLFTRIRNHEKYGDCLEGIPEDHTKHFTRWTEGVYQGPDSLDMFVLSRGGINAKWEHPRLGPVELLHTHPTGEIRWEVKHYGDPTSLNPTSAHEAVEFFGIRPKGWSDERWSEHLSTMKKGAA